MIKDSRITIGIPFISIKKFNGHFFFFGPCWTSCLKTYVIPRKDKIKKKNTNPYDHDES